MPARMRVVSRRVTRILSTPELSAALRCPHKGSGGLLGGEFGVDRLVESMRYSLRTPGKRIRPLLLLAVADAVRLGIADETTEELIRLVPNSLREAALALARFGTAAERTTAALVDLLASRPAFARHLLDAVAAQTGKMPRATVV